MSSDPHSEDKGLNEAKSTQQQAFQAEAPDHRPDDLTKALPNVLICYLGEWLDLQSAGRYLSTCKTIAKNRTHILNAVLNPHSYPVFIQLDHPMWKPGTLSAEMNVNMHRWFFQAYKMSNDPKFLELIDVREASPEERLSPISSTTRNDFARAFKLFYSAGCLGHMNAAHYAGKMLLGSDFTSLIPGVIQYQDLEPEVVKWDVCRLNMTNTGIVILDEPLSEAEYEAFQWPEFTVENAKILEERLKLIRIELFLSQTPCRLLNFDYSMGAVAPEEWQKWHSLNLCGDDIDPVFKGEQNLGMLGQPIHNFLCHLILTRNSTVEQFEAVRPMLKWFVAERENYDISYNYRGRKDLWARIKKHFQAENRESSDEDDAI